MDTADGAPHGHRAVGLGDVQAVPDIGQDLRVAKPFEKAAPSVPVNTRGEDPGAVDIERIHAETVALRIQGRYDLTYCSYSITYRGRAWDDHGMPAYRTGWRPTARPVSRHPPLGPPTGTGGDSPRNL